MMKKSILRILALALTLCMLALSLLACDQFYLTDPPAELPSSPAEETEQAGETQLKPMPPEVEPSEKQQASDEQNEDPLQWVDISKVEERVKPRIEERFDGQVIRFAVCNDYRGLGSRSIDLGKDDDPTNTVNVQIAKRNAQVEKELGVKIELEKAVSTQVMVPEMTPILASNLYVYDVLGLNQYFDLGLCLGDTVGKFYNLNSMPEGYTNYLNLDAPYWNKMLSKETGMKAYDVSFYMTGDLSLSYMGGLYVSFVNADLWAKYADEIAKLESAGGYSDPYEIVKKGYWTMDLLIDLADLVYLDKGNTKGEVDYEDQVGLMTYNETLNNTMADVLVAGAHVQLGGYDEEGYPTVAINTKENKAFMEKLYTLLCKTKAATIPWLEGTNATDPEDSLYIMNLFKKGNTLVTLNTLQCAQTHLADMEGDYLILPPPMLTSGQYDPESLSLGYSSQVAGDLFNHYAICKAIKDQKIPAVTATLELMAYYSALWVTPAYVKTVLRDNYSDPNALLMLGLTRAGIYTDFMFVWSNELDNINWKFRNNYAREDRISANLKSWHRSVQGKLNKLLPSIYESSGYIE
ncbi:MAG: hypothetical protein IJX08_04710 [Clostridia bacterium]|nr:hypothetical protein [Clostridia bacterium]